MIGKDDGVRVERSVSHLLHLTDVTLSTEVFLDDGMNLLQAKVTVAILIVLEHGILCLIKHAIAVKIELGSLDAFLCGEIAHGDGLSHVAALLDEATAGRFLGRHGGGGAFSGGDGVVITCLS